MSHRAKKVSAPDKPIRRRAVPRPYLPNPVEDPNDGKGPAVTLYAYAAGLIVPFIVSPDDYAELAGRTFSFSQAEYPVFYVGFGRRGVVGKRVYVHRHVMTAPVDKLVDHANGQRLDCRRGNLRLATKSQNNANRPSRGNAPAYSSRFRGVARHRGGWQAHMTAGSRGRYLGFFRDEIAAALAYNAAATAAFGEFAVLNDVQAPPAIAHSTPEAAA